mgnify:FL=1
MKTSTITIFCVFAFLTASLSVAAQEYDLLMKNGHLIDAKN